jgi:hypothetical protein
MQDPYSTTQTHPSGDAMSEASTGPLRAISPSQPSKISRSRLLLLILVSFVVCGAGALLFLNLFTPSNTFVAQPSTAGQVVFANSGQLDPSGLAGLNDVVTVTLHGVQTPATGHALYAWLRPDQGQDEVRPVLLGVLHPHAGQAQLTYSDPQHADLLATYSSFLVTEESASILPETPSLDSTTYRFQASIPTIPVPGDVHHFSLLSHLRHLLAQDPDVEAIGLHGGLNLWLYRNSLSVVDEANSARDYWQGGQATAFIHRQVVRVLDYLDGFQYVGLDVPFINPATGAETPFMIDRKLGAIGLLTFSQRQAVPGYLVHISLHLNGAINSPGISPAQKALATSLDAALTQIIAPLFQRVHDDAAKLVKMNDAQLQTQAALSLLNDMATNANAAVAGPIDPATGNVGKGITWLHAAMEQLVVLSVTNPS